MVFSHFGMRVRHDLRSSTLGSSVTNSTSYSAWGEPGQTSELFGYTGREYGWPWFYRTWPWIRGYGAVVWWLPRICYPRWSSPAQLGSVSSTGSGVLDEVINGICVREVEEVASADDDAIRLHAMNRNQPIASTVNMECRHR